MTRAPAALRDDERRLAAAIVAFAREHGVPNRVSFGELAAHFGAADTALRAGAAWGRANVAVAGAVALCGFAVRRAAEGGLDVAALPSAPD